AIEAYMVEPWKLLGKDGKADLPVLGKVELIPRTLDRGQIIVMTKGSEADVVITLFSSSEAQAIEDAKALNASWGFIQLGAKYEYKLDLPDMKFEPKGLEISAKGHLDQKALEAAYDLGKKKTEEGRNEKSDDD